MNFSQYLKECRENNDLTQEQLAHSLYRYNDAEFKAIDTNTISRWERDASSPKLSRQVNIIRYFQSTTGNALPCWEDYDVLQTEKMICEAGMHNLLGKSKELILNFPSGSIGTDELEVSQLRNCDIIDEVIDIHMGLDKSLRHKYKDLQASHFESWALHNANSFYVCRYKGQFFGLLFTLRLKPGTFERIMNLEIREKDLTQNDFASFDEMGCSYIISFFAMSEKAASILFIRYFAHLIAHQKVIKEVGVSVIMDDARKLLSHMRLKHYASLNLGDNKVIDTYCETLSNFLASEYVVKMILSKSDCPQE